MEERDWRVREEAEAAQVIFLQCLFVLNSILKSPISFSFFDVLTVE